ncbi:MAG: helix-turn-helix protein [Sphingobacteriales bacterium]|nr:helix-turn-helix protein [Sphingobacteriales bacterium]
MTNPTCFYHIVRLEYLLDVPSKKTIILQQKRYFSDTFTIMALNYPQLQMGTTEGVMPFEMHTAQWIHDNRWEQNSTPHKHNYFVIVWVKKGSGVHLIDLDRYDVHDNTIYCISPGQIHLLKLEDKIDGFVISFTNDFLCLTEENFDLLFNSGLFYTSAHSPVISVDAEMQEELDDVCHRMLKEYGNFFLLRSEILRGYLKIFLIHLTRQFQTVVTQQTSKNVELVKNFFSLLEKSFSTKKMVTDYAADLNVSPNYLNEIIKKKSGIPASDHIKNRIVLEAKRHAAYSDVSMKEVAYSLGFDDVAHFSKYFKNTTGINFSDFKKDLASLMK